MVDTHCHILPGIDDGAIDLEDSIAMARQAEADGITAICATPHIRHDHDVRIDELAGRVEELESALRGAGVSIRILAGGELAETRADGLTDDELATIALGDGRWLLVEPAPGPLSDSLVEVARRLRRRGFECLVAHPERHPGNGARGRLATLVEEGALVQLTAAALSDPASARPLLELARDGLAHVLGSDSHSARYGRPVRLAAAAAPIAEDLGGAAAAFVNDRPAAIVGGADPRAIGS